MAAAETGCYYFKAVWAKTEDLCLILFKKEGLTIKIISAHCLYRCRLYFHPKTHSINICLLAVTSLINTETAVVS